MWHRRFKSFRQVIDEMAVAATGVNDEHALAHLWNHGIKKYNGANHKNPDTIHKDIDKARGNPNHPLHISNFHPSGFLGGHSHGKEGAYYKELHSSVPSYTALAKHPKTAKAHAQGHPMEVSGSGRGELSNLWKKHNAGNATSKADVVIRNPKNAEDHHGISMKKGPAQIMSGHHAEWAATMEAASNRAQKMGHHDAATHTHIMNQVNKIGKLAHGFETAKKGEQERRMNKIKTMHSTLHNQHPHMLGHMTHEAASGEQKFKSNEGRAHMVLTAHENHAHIHDLTNPNAGNIPSKTRVGIKSHGSGGKVDRYGKKIPGKQSVAYRLDTVHQPTP